MKKTALALAAVFALTGAALASEAVKGKHAQSTTACMHKTTKLDCGATGSLARPGPVKDKNATAPKQPRLGINIDPWFLPNTF